MGEISNAFVDAFFAAFDPKQRAPEHSHAGDYEVALARAIGDALEAALKADGPGRHFHFHPPEGSILSAMGDAVLIESQDAATARLARGISIHDLEASTSINPVAAGHVTTGPAEQKPLDLADLG